MSSTDDSTRQALVPAGGIRLGRGCRTAFWAVWCSSVLAAPLQADTPNDIMIKVRLAGGLFEGQPLWWSASQVNLLARDGRLVSFRPDDANDFQRSSPRFYSYSPSEMRGRLHAEFGRDFDVTATSHYLVVHPRGQKSQWAERFEQLYRSFYHYFQVRGFKLHEARFPLVAIVFGRQEDYLRHAAEEGQQVSPNFLGHYSGETNRIYLYDVTEGNSRGDWTQNAATIIHEATHQTAFNSGVHSRFAQSPRWITEGLATMFEAPGVSNSLSFQSQRHRINEGCLADFKQLAAGRPDGVLVELIASDRLFSGDPSRAYAEAWALSFYLCETQPRNYTKYLALTSARPAFQAYSAEERLADFSSVFGKEWKLFDAQFLRYMARLK